MKHLQILKPQILIVLTYNQQFVCLYIMIDFA